MPKVSFDVKGLDSVIQNLNDVSEQIGDKKASSKILVPALRQAIKPALESIRRQSPKDTGALAQHLWIEARRPNKRDKRSKYVNVGDNAIALVTTKAFPKKRKKEWMAQNANLTGKERSAAFKKYALSTGFPYDARAIAQEFGSARNPPHPFMRTGMESASPAVLQNLGGILKNKINSYKAKNPQK